MHDRRLTSSQWSQFTHLRGQVQSAFHWGSVRLWLCFRSEFRLWAASDFSVNPALRISSPLGACHTHMQGVTCRMLLCTRLLTPVLPTLWQLAGIFSLHPLSFYENSSFQHNHVIHSRSAMNKKTTSVPLAAEGLVVWIGCKCADHHARSSIGLPLVL